MSKPHPIWLIMGSSLLLLLMVALLPHKRDDVSALVSPNRPAVDAHSTTAARTHLQRRTKSPVTPASAEEIVSARLNQFARSRRQMARELASRAGIEVPPEVERFFAAVEAGRWDEMDALYQTIQAQKKQESPPFALRTLGHVVLETLGVAQSVQKWPAQKLLDYGNSILDSLRPGMVYVGGTDSGRYIPTLLNETRDGERHIVVTQNAFADATYLDYMSFLYGDRFATLTREDSDRAFQNYLSDARKRLQHDEQFPGEPKQIRPGEDVRLIENRTQVSGQIAVMAINERLLQMLMAKNPDASFALEQSFPFASLYKESSPLGPIMELRVQDSPNVLTPERAAQSVDYWRAAAQELLSDPVAHDAHGVRMTYAKMAADQAALLLARNYNAEAEQAFRLATEIAPGSPEAVYRYVNLLLGQGRIGDALPIVEAAVRTDANNQQQFRALRDELNRMMKN
jgi:tetratricopeptide (TPR) repeat protein